MNQSKLDKNCGLLVFDTQCCLRYPLIIDYTGAIKALKESFGSVSNFFTVKGQRTIYKPVKANRQIIFVEFYIVYELGSTALITVELPLLSEIFISNWLGVINPTVSKVINSSKILPQLFCDNTFISNYFLFWLSNRLISKELEVTGKVLFEFKSVEKPMWGAERSSVEITIDFMGEDVPIVVPYIFPS